MTSLVFTKTADGQNQFKEKMSDDELKAFIAAAKEKADGAEMAEEAYEFNVVPEFTKIVDGILKDK